MSIVDRLFGRRLASHEEEAQRVGPLAGIPMLGLDALSSAAYGPEAALTLLLPLGILGIGYIVPITGVIIGLLLIVYLSYRQTIAAYPSGGGSYTVASENLGRLPGMLVSALPALHSYILPLCLCILSLIALVNLRGVRESGLAFMIPTYLFVVCLFAVLAIGLVKVLLSGGQPVPVVPPHVLPGATAGATLWLLMRAFASGCTAMTGVEAVSNGVTAFRSPAVPNARRTLAAIVAILVLLIAGIALLARAYGIGATEPGVAGYESVISQLVAAVVGKGGFYYLTIGAVLVVLSLSANTSFAGFPRLCQIVACDDYLPNAFAHRGRRLVFSLGIYVLTACAALLLVIFGAITDRLIPLFAVGALLAFTMSQSGMVAHWLHTGGPGVRRNLLINGVGAAATGLTLMVVLVAKFAEGAWITLLIIPALLLVFDRVHRHYANVEREIACPTPLDLSNLQQPIVVVPIRDWDVLAHKGLRFAIKLSSDVHAVHIRTDDASADLEPQWEQLVAQPARGRFANATAPRAALAIPSVL